SVDGWLSVFVCVVGIAVCFFFFQAEDGIRDWSVTGVQTCALPISPAAARSALLEREVSGEGQWVQTSLLQAQIFMLDFQAARWRSEERRVGKEWRSRWGRYQ